MPGYPISKQMPLPKASRNGWRPRSRPLDELPVPNAYEVVVYKSGDSYVIDDGRSRPTDSHIVNATSVSVVDMQEEVPVTAQVPIPSAGAGEFTVQATFLCTVRNAEDVISSGLTDMEEALSQYLMRHQPLFHVGENFEFDEIATVRLNAEAAVKAHTSVRPPRFRGVELTLGNVQVLTPEELAKFESLRREGRQNHLLARERTEQQQYMDITRQQYHHELKTQSERNSQELAELQRQLIEGQELQKRRHEQLVAQMHQQFEQTQGMRQFEYQEAQELQQTRHDQFLAGQRQGFEQSREQRQLEHDQAIRTQKFEHAIAEGQKLGGALGANSTEIPSLLAASAGERTLAQTADQLTQGRQAARESDEANALRREIWAREDAQIQWRADRDDARNRYNLKVQELKAQLEIFSAGITRGLADTHTIDKLVGVLGGAVKQLESVAADVPPADSPSMAASPDTGDEPLVDAEVIDDPASRNDPETSEHRTETTRAGASEPGDDSQEDRSVADDSLNGEPQSEESEPEVREEDLGD